MVPSATAGLSMNDAPSSPDPWKRSSLPTMPRRSPWGPCAEDCLFLSEAVAPALAAAGGMPRVLVLGVTPEIVQLDWPDHATLVAVDSSAAMIDRLWHPHPVRPSEVILARWQDLPLADASVDAAVGDGSLNALTELDDYGVVAGQLARALRPSGRIALRCFVRPDGREDPESLMKVAEAGDFPTVGAFRLRLAMALTDDAGVLRVADLARTFIELMPDRDRLAAAARWSRVDIDRIDADIGSPLRFTFPTLDQLRDTISPHLALADRRHGSYTQAELCPTLLFLPA